MPPTWYSEREIAVRSKTRESSPLLVVSVWLFSIILATLGALVVIPAAFAAELPTPPSPTFPRLENLPPMKGDADPASLARRYEQSRRGAQTARAQPSGPTLYVFVSLTMPPASMASILDQAARSAAVIKVRGLQDRSIKKTAETIRTLIGERNIAMEIDPDAFKRYGVKAVPAVVLASPVNSSSTCTDAACIPDNSFAIITGDVTIDHALDLINRQYPPLASAARTYIKRIRSPS
jgi:conjugal transfer pilus assembly protein TrbC